MEFGERERLLWLLTEKERNAYGWGFLQGYGRKKEREEDQRKKKHGRWRRMALWRGTAADGAGERDGGGRRWGLWTAVNSGGQNEGKERRAWRRGLLLEEEEERGERKSVGVVRARVAFVLPVRRG